VTSFKPGISGPGLPVLNTTAIYDIPTVLPDGVSFVDWTVSGGAYEAIGGLSDPTLTIIFSDPTGYTITANFRMPDGTIYSRDRIFDLNYLDNISITGPDISALNNNAIFNIPATLRNGVTFIGWSISPNSNCEVSGGTTGRSFSVKFIATGTYTISASFTLPGNIPYSVTKTIAVKARLKLVERTGVRKLNSAILDTDLINAADPDRVYFTDTGIREEFLASNNGTHSFYYLPRDYIQIIADVVLKYPYYTDSSDLRYGYASPVLEYLYI
jgi:hypothetical protein